MRTTYILLGLLAVIGLVSILMSFDPEHSERLAEMRRNAGFSGESRDMVLLLLALGLGGFIAYLTFIRR
jgi:predicted MFS family arabinose efflux permease